MNQTVITGVRAAFDLDHRVAVITGGAGMLGIRHGEAVAELGGIPVLVDLNPVSAKAAAEGIMKDHGCLALGLACDITNPEAVDDLKKQILEQLGRVDILINNAANNPKVAGGGLQGG
ncbi:MAG: SDR family NAD(P)-dependent oxidoreductase, partial [Magnetococcus sp. YQC-5]